MKLKVLGINSGLGVSLYPFRKHCIGNLEMRGIFHTKCNSQWKANFGDTPLWKDPHEVDDKIKPNIIISSPDCGSGSVFRLSRAKKLGDHKNNHSLAVFFESIRKYLPELFLFENLDGLFKSFPEVEFDQILEHYYLVKHRESVSVFGNSQVSRKRLVIVGVKKTMGHNLKYWERIFAIPRKLFNPRPCCEILSGIDDTLTGVKREPLDSVISIHARKRMSLRDIQIEWQGRLSGRKRWTVVGGNFSTAPGVYRNLDTDFPATARKANRQFDASGLTLTPRHLARIQGVPDQFIIHMEPKNPGYWINKGRTTVTKTPPMQISVWFKARIRKYGLLGYPKKAP